MVKLKYIFFILMYCSSNLLLGQKGHPILDNYTVLEISGKVFISVTVSSGQTCNGINVQRSADSLSYSQIGHVGGICGNSASPITYSFTDESPIKNQKSFYRVELGGFGYTDVVSILLIDTKDFGFHVRPNPANEKTIIYFENPELEEFELILFNLSGSKLLTELSSNNSFELITSNLNNGLYFFSISNANRQQKIIGKLMVQH